MIKSEVGVLIRKGYTVEKIREAISDFPNEPNKEYLQSIGYSETTAVSYLSILRKNEAKNKEQKYNNVLTMSSKQVNMDNIILDTSAIAHKECNDVIDKSKRVTVLYCVIREMDALSKNKRKPAELKTSIRAYTDRMLREDEKKFRLVPYKLQDTREADDIIIEYMLEQPLRERPTLITADRRLALKAKCAGLEYIVYGIKDERQSLCDVEDDEKTYYMWKNKEDLHNVKKIKRNKPNNVIAKMGVKVVFNESCIDIAKYNDDLKVFAVSNSECNVVSESKIRYEVDYIAIMAQIKKYGIVKVSKIVMENGKTCAKDFEYSCEEDIDKSEGELSPLILETVEKLMIPS